MDNAPLYIMGTILIGIAVFALTAVFKLATASGLPPIQIYEAGPGIRCAVMTRGSYAAIDCWEVE